MALALALIAVLDSPSGGREDFARVQVRIAVLELRDSVLPLGRVQEYVATAITVLAQAAGWEANDFRGLMYEETLEGAEGFREHDAIFLVTLHVVNVELDAALKDGVRMIHVVVHLVVIRTSAGCACVRLLAVKPEHRRSASALHQVVCKQFGVDQHIQCFLAGGLSMSYLAVFKFCRIARHIASDC